MYQAQNRAAGAILGGGPQPPEFNRAIDRQEPGVAQAMHRLTGSLNSLEEALSILHARLEPVLFPQPQHETAGVSDPVGGSALCVSIAQTAARVSHLKDYVTTMTYELEI